MKANSSTIKLMVLENTYIMNRCKSTAESGRMICNMAMEEKSFAITLYTRATLSKVKSTVKENTFGPTPRYTKASGKITR